MPQWHRRSALCVDVLADAPGADDYTQDPELEWIRDG
jgi:hypothetical protein